jgi:C-terminal processing protease CtpA/Prc
MLRELDARYVFPERLKQQRGELVRRWSAPRLAQLTSAKALAKAMDDDLRDLFHDAHLGVRVARPDRAPPPAGEPSAAELAAMERQLANEHFGVVRAEILPGNIGYLRIDGFAPADFAGTQRAYVDAMGFVGDTKGLILDLRDNHGGDGQTAALLMSYLLDGKRLLLKEYWRATNKTTEDWTRDSVAGRRYGEKRPVWVLTSGETFSAGEELAYDVQTLKRGTIVGASTGGGANHNVIIMVGKRFMASIPIGTTQSPVTGTNWEGVGVKPDLSVAGDKALDVALAAARRAVAAPER